MSYVRNADENDIEFRPIDSMMLDFTSALSSNNGTFVNGPPLKL